ncbi:MAG: type IV pilus twitching motility protein PilT [Nitrospinota bacterium]
MRENELNHILETALNSNANVSDINLTAGKPIQVEASGLLKSVHFNSGPKVLTPYQTELMALNLLKGDPRLMKSLVDTGSADTSHYIGDKVRFRVNIFSQQNRFSLVLRQLSTTVPTVKDLDLPKIMNKLAEEHNGLILVTGATGSGKSTTLAAVLELINKNKSVHVITLEDPVEFLHKHKQATFNQRELGRDFDSFSTGLRAALRQAPKVILVGEMRDRETMEIGLTAAETGHLVLSTLHTVDAGQTINRVIGMFDLEEEKLIRTRLSESLRWVVSQRLLPKEGGGRVAALEIMGSNLRTKELVQQGAQEGKASFYELITDSLAYGWRTFDHAIIDLYEKKLISEETAVNYASRKPIVQRGIDSSKAKRGERTSDIDDLSIDDDYAKKL